LSNQRRTRFEREQQKNSKWIDHYFIGWREENPRGGCGQNQGVVPMTDGSAREKFNFDFNDIFIFELNFLETRKFKLIAFLVF